MHCLVGYLPHLKFLRSLQIGGWELATSTGPKGSEESEVLPLVLIPSSLSEPRLWCWGLTMAEEWTISKDQLILSEPEPGPQNERSAV